MTSKNNRKVKKNKYIYILAATVCDKLIKDASSKKKVQDCVFCEGSCEGCIHRKCVGIPKPV